MIDVDRAPHAPPWLARRTKPTCLLCGRPTKVSAIYFPGKDSPASAPPGKCRMILYSLCDGCARRPNVQADLVEPRIEQELRKTGTI